jgi:hypothetical protein
MTTTNELTQFIRPIAGKTLTLMIVLRIMGGRTTPAILCAITGWSLPTVRKHMQTAIAFNYVKMTDNYHNPVYYFTDGITQLEFFDFQSEKVLQIAPTTTMLINDSNNNIKDIKSSSTQSERILQINQEVFDILKECGVGEPKRSQLASLEHATFDYVAAHVQKWSKEKQPPGLLIYRIEKNDPAPELKIECPNCGKYGWIVDGRCLIEDCGWEVPAGQKKHKESKYAKYIKK